MKMFLISDNSDTCTGMRLAGVDGVIVHTGEEVEKAFAEAESNPDIGVLLVTEKISDLRRDLVDYHKLNQQLPLLVEIPDRHSRSRVDGSIAGYVREAIGIKI